MPFCVTVFFFTKNINGKVIRGRKTNESSDTSESTALAAVDVIFQGVLPSKRQSAEWGIRALKETIPILKVFLSAGSKKGYWILAVCVCLLNLRTWR